MLAPSRPVFLWLAAALLAAGTAALAEEGDAESSRPPEEGGTSVAKQPEGGKEPAAGEEFDLQAALAQLAHDDFQQRLKAQQALLAWGKEDLDARLEAVYQAYRRNRDPEIRLRTREVLRDLVIRKQPWDGQGYLGIQMEAAQRKTDDGRMQPVILVTKVREGTAASEAGVEEDDLIVAVDNLTFKDLDARLPFGEYIKSKKPGVTVTLAVRRDKEDLRIKAVLRRRSPVLDRLTPWGGLPELPDQAELDEADFREWLQQREALDGK